MRFISSAILLIILSILLGKMQAQNSPATEIRAVWLTTNWNLDWPKANQSADSQKRDLKRILDKLQQAHFNTVLFQVRVRGDVFYKSRIEPWSPFFQKSAQVGSYAPYDPLQFAIEECHKRGLECHAWFVTFPLGSQKQVKSQKNNIAAKRPSICKLHRGEWYLDPGNPQARDYILSLVDEIVTNYDIDGIHFDYIRYPEEAARFPDKDTHRKYGRGLSLKEWRVNNITTLVTNIYDRVKAKKAWVQVSCSPLGRYRSLNPRRGTWTAYESVHQDAGKWMQLEKMDAIYPMLYYKDTQFGDYIEDWISVSNGRFVNPGLGVYRMLSAEGNWSSQDISEQIASIRRSNSSGEAFYRAGNILDNTKGILDILKSDYYTYPAKVPPMKWLNNTAPNSPLNMQVYRNESGSVSIEWESSDLSEQQTYTLYESHSEDFDINDPKTIIRTRIHGNKIHLDIPDSDRASYFSVTASDRFNNESVPCFPTFFIHSKTLEK